MDWINTGDINPLQGTAFYRKAQIDENGDFNAEAIEVISEQNVGGDEKRFLLRMGDFFLAKENFASALDTVGARLDGMQIIRDTADGNERILMTSEEGMRELFIAGYAYSGLQSPEWDLLIQIGKDEEYDQDRKFTGERHMYRAGTSVWAVIANELPGFELPEGVTSARPYRYDEPEEANPGF
ncbi:hypothetical protein KUV57_13500 [Epibacterium sp. DP7N7-1]|nr:hypothetical protein [Epibacterium sp. DP7N7-1]